MFLFLSIYIYVFMISSRTSRRHGFAAIHMQIRAVRTSGSSTYVMVHFRQYVAQTNTMFADCKLSLTAKN